MYRLIAAVTWIGFLVIGTLAKIEHVSVVNDDRTIIPLSEAFAFGPRGHIDITLKRLLIRVPHTKQTYRADAYGFLLSSADGEATLEEELTASRCPLTKGSGQVIIMQWFSDPGIQALLNGTAKNFSLQYSPPSTGLYYLYFANCEPGFDVSFRARIEMYNVDAYGNRDYLSLGETELDAVYWVMFGLFTAVTIGWAVLITQNKETVHKIHYLMLLLGVFKGLTLLSQALMYHYIELYGKPDGWNIAYYIFTFFRGLLFFTVVILVGTGWSYMRPFIGDKEKRILMVVLPLQVFANIAIIITEEESPALRDWFTWRDVFHLVDIICCCAILFPIVWSIKHLREASQTDGKAARNLEKLTLFRQFYVMVVIYIYFTRIVVYLLKTTVEYRYSWVSEAADQLATLAFYVWTGVKFRPHKENPYFKLSNEDIES